MLRHLAVVAVVAVVVLGVGVAPTPAAPVYPVVTTEVALSTATRAAGRATSGVVDAAPFALVALELPGEVAAEVRTRRGDGGWAPWTPMPHMHDEGPDPGSDEAVAANPHEGTHPLFTGAADQLQVRVDGGLEGTTAILLDPFGRDRSATQRAIDTAMASWRGEPRDRAHAADAPPIVSRAGWGADESIVVGLPGQARQLDRMFVHHTVGANGYSQDQSPGIVRAIQAYHVNDRGWSDIGYNFLVDRFGTIYEGRAGGIDQAVIGAQAGGFNTGSSGVALMGTYTSATPSAEATAAIAELVAWKAGVHHFDPLGMGEAVSGGSSRYEEGVVVTLPNLAGHRDVSSTTCPGDGPYALLDQMRTVSREAAGDLIVEHSADLLRTRVIRGDPDADAVTMQARLDPPGPWTIEVYDPDGDTVHSASGEGAQARTTMAMTGDEWMLGDYQWAVTSPGRTTAFEHLALEPPVIADATPSTPLALVDDDGGVRTPVAFTATLWRDAAWTLELHDPDGDLAHRQEGVGEAMHTSWAGPVAVPGTWTWTVRAEDASPVGGQLEVRHDVLDRVADTDDPAVAARQISARTFADGGASHAVVARADLFADALAGGPLAGTDGPLLLTDPTSLDPAVAAELERVLQPDAPIFVLGGTAAVSADVADQLATIGPVQRLAGTSRVATAAAIAEVVVARTGADTALVARAGPDDVFPWADALAGGAYGAWAGLPLLITDSDDLSPETATALDDLDIVHTLVLGGEAAIAPSVTDVLPDPRRLAGPDRSATAAQVAARWAAEAAVSDVVLASGYGDSAWAWALTAAPLSARTGAPLLLTSPDSLSPATADALSALGVTGGVVVGPAGLVAEAVSLAASDVIVGR